MPCSSAKHCVMHCVHVRACRKVRCPGSRACCTDRLDLHHRCAAGLQGHSPRPPAQARSGRAGSAAGAGPALGGEDDLDDLDEDGEADGALNEMEQLAVRAPLALHALCIGVGMCVYILCALWRAACPRHQSRHTSDACELTVCRLSFISVPALMSCACAPELAVFRCRFRPWSLVFQGAG